MTRGLVIGKFYPPHLGHAHLINYALAHSDELTVLICDSPRYLIPASKRQEWLQKIHPSATVKIIPDLEDDDNSEAWAKHTLDFLGQRPDVVFSSENYGIAYARFMKSRHVMVDRERLAVPISATKVRRDLIHEWSFLHPVVKADLALRVVVVGAESTGTTTLATGLAEHYSAPVVLEFGRLYSESFLSTEHQWTQSEFVAIAAAQQAYERTVAQHSNGLIICDTNAFASTIWQERYMGKTTSDVAAIAGRDIVDHYLLTSDDIPFVQDGTRDGEHIRHDMHRTFLTELRRTGVPFTLINGSKNERLQKAAVIVDELLASPSGAFERSVRHLLPAAQAL